MALLVAACKTAGTFQSQRAVPHSSCTSGAPGRGLVRGLGGGRGPRGLGSRTQAAAVGGLAGLAGGARRGLGSSARAAAGTAAAGLAGLARGAPASGGPCGKQTWKDARGRKRGAGHGQGCGAAGKGGRATTAGRSIDAPSAGRGAGLGAESRNWPLAGVSSSRGGVASRSAVTWASACASVGNGRPASSARTGSRRRSGRDLACGPSHRCAPSAAAGSTHVRSAQDPKKQTHVVRGSTDAPGAPPANAQLTSCQRVGARRVCAPSMHPARRKPASMAQARSEQARPPW